MDELFLRLGPLLNESLSATIAIISGSFFLYSLVKDIRNRVARAFSALLFFVTITYIGDMGVSFAGNRIGSVETWLRFQWLGIAFAPAAYVHVSDAILEMTGLASRGRRRWGVRFLYLAATVFFLLVALSDAIVRDVDPDPAPHFLAGSWFWLFMVYFVSSVIVSLFFVIRARRRSLTASSRRRMTYLLLTYPAPAIAVFPFLLVSGNTALSPALFYGVLMLADVVLAVMLTFMAYVMAFFASLLPDRAIKSQMLQFFLRGPVVAIAILAIIVWVPRAGAVLGLPGEEVMPFLAVAAILFLQWTITLIRPKLEEWLIYVHDQREISRIRQLENRLLTAADFKQLLDSILAALCDYLRVEAAFVASLGSDGPHMERTIGLDEGFISELDDASEMLNGGERPEAGGLKSADGDVFAWRDFWLVPLYSQHDGVDPMLVGILGVASPNEPMSPDDGERWQMLMALASRAAEVLEDRRLQQGVFRALEGLLPEMDSLMKLSRAARYGGIEQLTNPVTETPVSEDLIQSVKDALGQYWGGPKLTDSRLMNLAVVQQALAESEGNPQRAMRTVLQQAIENLRPEGQRSMTTTEWILYNILEMRFIQGRKVRDVAMRLAMSESDLYRKQRVAIESVASIIAELERLAAEDGSDEPPASAGNEQIAKP